MAIKKLTPEQIQTMSLEEKDEWWLKNVYRGDMPQLTLRSGLTGFLLGGVLSLTNLYIGSQTGWTLGVGITSVIVTFAMFKVLSKIGLGKEMTVLENNAMQSIATSAGYVCAPLFTSLGAYTMVKERIVPMHQVIVWMLCIAVTGVLFAFPMKKRFINDEQHPFPEGMAAGVVMDALHESDEKDGLFKAKLLGWGGLIAAIIEFIRDEKVMRWFFALPSIPEYFDELYDPKGKLGFKVNVTEMLSKAAAAGKQAAIDKVFKPGSELLKNLPAETVVPFRELTVRMETSIIMMATGGLSGIRTGVSLLVGGILNYCILAPMMIRAGVILPRAVQGDAGSMVFLYGFRTITVWALWGGVACMTTSSIYAFLSKPKMILDAIKGALKKGSGSVDRLAHIELPIKVSVIGVPIVGTILVLLAHSFFDVPYAMGFIAIPLVFVFTLIGVNSTALTSITPTGALGKLTQLTFGALAPKNISTNLMTAGITAEVASNASNLLMDIKPGYMLGAKPRQQAIGHVMGALAGSLASVPIWYFVFIRGDISQYGSDKLPVPSALVWKAVAELMMSGLENLEPTARVAVVVGAIVGIVVEISKQVTKNKFPLSAVGLGLAFVINFFNIWSMFLGAFIFWMLERSAKKWEKEHEPKEKSETYRTTEDQPPPPPPPKKPWYVLGAENTETICAGVIAGGALMGILVNVLDILVLPNVLEPKSFAKVVTAMAHLGAPK